MSISNYPHWQHLIALDSDLYEASRYVQICQDNFDTYSIELVHILLAACSEIDAVAKVLCKQIDPIKKYENMSQYRVALTTKYLKLHTMEITVPWHGISFIPWSEWGAGKNPTWWSDYNKVKHNRDINFQKAHLNNALYAVGGLFVLLCYLHVIDLNRASNPFWPKLLAVHERYILGTTWAIDFRLPERI